MEGKPEFFAKNDCLRQIHRTAGPGAATFLHNENRRRLLPQAESFFNVASYVDEVSVLGSHGDKSLHAQSRGESFLSLLQNRFTRSGLYLLHEPETALSPQRHLGLLAILHDLLSRSDEIQFLIATHSPILLAYPDPIAGQLVFTLRSQGHVAVLA